jgi:hypothetical protein
MIEIQKLQQDIIKQQEFAKQRQLNVSGEMSSLSEKLAEEEAWSGYYKALQWVLNQIEVNKVK